MFHAPAWIAILPQIALSVWFRANPCRNPVQARAVAVTMFNIKMYDEPEAPNEGGVFKIDDDLEPPNEAAC